MTMVMMMMMMMMMMVMMMMKLWPIWNHSARRDHTERPKHVKIADTTRPM